MPLPKLVLRLLEIKESNVLMSFVNNLISVVFLCLGTLVYRLQSLGIIANPVFNSIIFVLFSEGLTLIGTFLLTLLQNLNCTYAIF
jgi:hypothetical protein